MLLNIDPKLALLRALLPGETVSLGEARKLTGFSESTLAESIAALTAVYPEIETSPGALTLNGIADFTDPDEFSERLSKELKERISQVGLYAVCESTNTEVIAMGNPAVNSLNVATAEYQTGGRGRRGRVWTSGFAGGLCLTVAFRIKPSERVMPTLTLAIGSTLAGVLDEYVTEDVLLKWPNDLILADGKLGGILVELSTLEDGDQLLRVGVGVNCVAPLTDKMSGELPALKPAALKDCAARSLNRTELVARLVSGIVDAYDRHLEFGFEGFRSGWQERDYLKHQAVQVFDDERVRHGTAVGIDRHGALRIATDEGEIKVMSGEVRVRRR